MSKTGDGCPNTLYYQVRTCPFLGLAGPAAVAFIGSRGADAGTISPPPSKTSAEEPPAGGAWGSGGGHESETNGNLGDQQNQEVGL